MKITVKVLFALVSTGAWLAAGVAQAQTPIAEFDFNTGDASSLTSTNGQYTLTQDIGQNPFPGAISFSTSGDTITGFAGLSTTQINSTALPTTNGFSVFTRLILNSAPQALGDGGLFGLFSGTVGTDSSVQSYGQISMMGRNNGGLSPFANSTTTGGNPLGPFPGIAPSVGTPLDLTLVYNPSTATIGGTTYTTPTVTLYFGGNAPQVVSLPAGSTLSPFTTLDLGNIFGQNFPVDGVTYQDVQVFDQALTDTQVVGITIGASVPEPSTWALMISSLVLLVAFTRFRTGWLTER